MAVARRCTSCFIRPYNYYYTVVRPENISTNNCPLTVLADVNVLLGVPGTWGKNYSGNERQTYAEGCWCIAIARR